MRTKFKMLASVSFLDRLNLVLRRRGVTKIGKKLESQKQGRSFERGAPVEHLHVTLDFCLRYRLLDERLDGRPLRLAPASRPLSRVKKQAPPTAYAPA
jgi:hypothetical protein